jgi:hypothetical protein
MTISTQTVWTVLAIAVAAAGQVFGIGGGLEKWLIGAAGLVTSVHVGGLHIRKAAATIASNASTGAADASHVLGQVAAALGTQLPKA